MIQTTPEHFNGRNQTASARFERKIDKAVVDRERTGSQLGAVKKHMLKSDWQTLREISEAVGAPEASCSARLRDLRKLTFGSYVV